MDDYSWTTGGDTQLTHRGLIAKGGYGEVHEVITLLHSLSHL